MLALVLGCLLDPRCHVRERQALTPPFLDYQARQRETLERRGVHRPSSVDARSTAF
jgi:hypothetical protein